MQGIVAAADTTRPDDRSRAHTGICVHHVAMMSSLSGQSGRSGESEDSKTDNNASGHSRSSSVIPPQGAHVNYSATWHSSHPTFPRALAPESARKTHHAPIVSHAEATRYATCTPNHKVILLQVPRNRSRRGEPSHQSPGHVSDFTAACDLPAQGAGSGGTHDD